MRERQRERERERRKKNIIIANTKKFMEFYLVVLHSAEQSEARQWIVARQVSCYNPLSCFNPVTLFCDKVLLVYTFGNRLVLGLEYGIVYNLG